MQVQLSKQSEHSFIAPGIPFESRNIVMNFVTYTHCFYI